MEKTVDYWCLGSFEGVITNNIYEKDFKFGERIPFENILEICEDTDQLRVKYSFDDKIEVVWFRRCFGKWQLSY